MSSSNEVVFCGGPPRAARATRNPFDAYVDISCADIGAEPIFRVAWRCATYSASSAKRMTESAPKPVALELGTPKRWANWPRAKARETGSSYARD